MLNRRTLMHLMGSAAITSCAPPQQNAPPKEGAAQKIVIVGAGIIGASIAYHLAKLGLDVSVIDKFGPATQTSRGTFAWINATWAKQPRAYHGLSQSGVSSWHGWQEELGIPVKWGGSLEWFDRPARQEKLARQIDEQKDWGEPASMVPREELHALEPHVDFGDTTSAALSGNDGAVDPELATRTLLEAAKAHGARLVYPCELLDVHLSKGRLHAVETSQGTMPATTVILATGAAPQAASRFAQSALPQRTTPGIIAITKPMPKLLNRLIVAPGIHMHQRLDGRIVLGEQDGAPGNAAHQMRLEGRPTTFPHKDFADQHFARMMAIAQQFVPALSEGQTAIEADAVHIGWRPLPLDGHPVLGFSTARPDIYLAVMHSGVSLAPIVGQLVAQEVATRTLIERLSIYRPDRQFEAIQRY